MAGFTLLWPHVIKSSRVTLFASTLRAWAQKMLIRDAFVHQPAARADKFFS